MEADIKSIEKEFLKLAPDAVKRCPVCEAMNVAWEVDYKERQLILEKFGDPEKFGLMEAAHYSYHDGRVQLEEYFMNNCPLCHGTHVVPLSWDDYREWLMEHGVNVPDAEGSITSIALLALETAKAEAGGNNGRIQ